MDPNETLTLIRRHLAELAASDTVHDRAMAADQLAWQVHDLDEWLSRGGFLPDAWARG